VLDFLSSSHTSETLTYILEIFSRHARELNSGNSVQPLYIVTDYSYALIHAVLHAFDKCTLARYLSVAMQVLEHKQSRAAIVRRTCMCLCVAHMVKSKSMSMDWAVLQTTSLVRGYPDNVSE